MAHTHDGERRKSRERRIKTISVTSGKGGVGKSTLLANIALSLGRQGWRVLILDGDLGMANQDVMFGMRADKSVEGVIKGTYTLKEAIIQPEENIYLIPGGSGIYGLQNLDIFQKRHLLDQVSELDLPVDFMLIDTASGIDDNVLYLNSAAQEVAIVLTPEPASLTDAYALIKVLNRKHNETRFSIVCNMVQDEAEAMLLYRKLSDVAERFLCVSLDYKGFVPYDWSLRAATKSQQLVVQSEPRANSSQAIRMVAEKLSGYGHMSNIKGGLQFFWEQLVGAAS